MNKFLSFVFIVPLYVSSQQIPSSFIKLKEAIPTIEVEIRYATSENFIGRSIDGYISNTAVGTVELSNALKNAQKILKSHKLGIKIFDSYRPQTAVNHFIRWSKLESDTINKSKYYPELKKNSLFDLGYISSKSGHSRGSTVDLTLIYLTGENKGQELDMGGEWDFFGDLSNYNFEFLSEEQKYNRGLLRKTLISSGFSPYEKEWWHFTLIDEPFPDKYFDFIVK